MAPHSSTLAWKIPWTEEPGWLQSMGSWRVRHDWATSLSLFAFMHWRRKWQPTSVFLPGESQGRGSVVGCRLWGPTESDTTEVTEQQQQTWRAPQYGTWYTLPHVAGAYLGLLLREVISSSSSSTDQERGRASGRKPRVIIQGSSVACWRRKWQLTPVFLPGESQGRRSLVGCRLQGRTESDTTEATQQQQQQCRIYCASG